MIAELMRHQPDEAKRGGRIRNPPVFVHANRGPLAPTTPATLVEVVRCEIFEDGRADLLLLPKAVSMWKCVWALRCVVYLYNIFLNLLRASLNIYFHSILGLKRFGKSPVRVACTTSSACAWAKPPHTA